VVVCVKVDGEVVVAEPPVIENWGESFVEDCAKLSSTRQKTTNSTFDRKYMSQNARQKSDEGRIPLIAMWENILPLVADKSLQICHMASTAILCCSQL